MTERPRLVGGLTPSGILLCLFSVLIGTALTSNPDLCWWWCWGCSVLLLVASLRGVIFLIPTDLPQSEQTLRPWSLMNLIFVGYNILTSVFFWLDLQGYRFTTFDSIRMGSPTQIQLASYAQYYYLIAQVGLLLGLGAWIRWKPRKTYRLRFKKPLATTLLRLAVVALVTMLAFRYIPGLAQLEIRSKGVLTVAGGLSLGTAYRTQRDLLPIALIGNVILLVLALVSGWKEEVLVLVILNSIAFYPIFPRTTTLVTTSIIAVGFVVLPPFANEIRKYTWSNNVGQLEALERSLQTINATPLDKLVDESWYFLTNRLSEQSMFVTYLGSVPVKREFYGSQIMLQAFETPIPRIFWPKKPITERLVHQRVVENGVVSALSIVSAKPQYIVDGYLSYGGLGVFASLFVFGSLIQIMSTVSEKLLGGYVIGGVLFNGMFSFCWRGACFEFFVNSFVWSVIIVFVLHEVGTRQGWIVSEPSTR